MSEEVKPTGIGLTISNINHDMMVRKLQSERQARLEAETKLRELQDAVERAISLNPKFEKLDTSVLDQAIQESRTRKK